jgi:predicted MFS family arabinose efflux permease
VHVRPPTSLRTTLTASGALTTAMLPVFLLGALSGLIRDDLGLDEAAIGAAVTVLFVVVGLTATSLGRLTERIGAGRALHLGVAVCGLATASIGAFASSFWHIALALAVVGIGLGAIDTGAARAFAEGIPPGRQGSAFGLKEASVPGASLLAGVALPTLGVVLGWRGTFVGALVVAALVLLLLPKQPRFGRSRSAPTPPGRTAGSGARTASAGGRTASAGRRTASAAGRTATELPGTAEGSAPTPLRIRWFAAGVGLGSGAATAGATFLAPAVTDRGLSTAAAGTVLAVASIASILVRIALGRWADRPTAPTVTATAVAIGVGAVGAGLLAAPVPPLVAVVGALALLGGGWGWTGLAFLSVVRAHAGAPAVAAGVVLTGLGIGGAAGPPAFGALASRVSYPAAWAATAAALGVAAAICATAMRRV